MHKAPAHIFQTSKRIWEPSLNYLEITGPRTIANIVYDPLNRCRREGACSPRRVVLCLLDSDIALVKSFKSVERVKRLRRVHESMNDPQAEAAVRSQIDVVTGRQFVRRFD